VVPDRKAPITSVSATLGSSLHCREKHRMYPQRVSSAFYQQFLRSYGFPGRLYVPWKFSTKISFRSTQLWILLDGRCSNHVRAESAKNNGKLRIMKSSLTAPSAWQASRLSLSHSPGFVSLEYFGILVGGRYLGGKATLRMCRLKA
jgi:hypothetical protein